MPRAKYRLTLGPIINRNDKSVHALSSPPYGAPACDNNIYDKYLQGNDA